MPNQSSKKHKYQTLVWSRSKGQVISKGFFGVFNFFQKKKNEQKHVA